MPLACLRVDYKPGVSECILVEHHNNSVDYKTYANLLCTLIKKQQQVISNSPTQAMDKALLRSLLQLCESDRERECLRYAVVKSSGLSTTQACKAFGFQNLSSRLSQVENAIKHAQCIRESIDKLARTKEKALLQSFGLECRDSSSDSEYSDVTDDEEPCREGAQLTCSVADMTKLVKDCEFNYFEVFHRVVNAVTTEELMSKLEELDITSNEKKKLKISHEAFIAEEDVNAVCKRRQADQMNGLIAVRVMIQELFKMLPNRISCGKSKPSELTLF
jgi:hypothetical protein